MLECVPVVGHIVIIIIGIGKETVARGEDIACAQVGSWQLSGFRFLDDKQFLGVIGQVLA